jgi:predicted amidophosphoribosyltransferase
MCDEFMAYCSNCSEKLPKDALFCPKCGIKTVKGVVTNAASPSDEMHEVFTRMSQEMERAFSIAAKEMHEAFQTARINIQKSLSKEAVVCANCGEKNLSSAVYCFRCGKKVQSEQAEKTKVGT